ncbi:hypothetical protein CAI21_22160 [Alkalilimnicola ehrlichii]|uniref:HTH marR-type domain-containing protein n=1 Tax=Alkalilimnicola ehrlichii TaxID=351052 RepID=A0A3E0WH40_9GAMM|nr:replication-relaxation family protein [Alkalilimnicola ehrlichii]RFA24309.1 hypothetical protein CAI21_22160 [Alkalilimnicola ehrlichii]RFA31553.1 hypothetical protein CAL65_22295 [Alkalilimnicola ehrlichii]
MRVRRLSYTARAVLRILAELEYATSDQLTVYLNVDRSTVTRTLRTLEAGSLVTLLRVARPYVVSATPAGLRAVAAKPRTGRRVRSWSAIAHRCHVNAAVLRLGAHFPGFRVLLRVDAFSLGLSPAHGEHLARSDDGIYSLLLMDDYFMSSERIVRVWRRRHRSKPAYYAPPAPRHWFDVADRFIVAVTDAEHLADHRAYLAQADVLSVFHTPAGELIAPKLLYVPALWQLA